METQCGKQQHTATAECKRNPEGLLRRRDGETLPALHILRLLQDTLSQQLRTGFHNAVERVLRCVLRTETIQPVDAAVIGEVPREHDSSHQAAQHDSRQHREITFSSDCLPCAVQELHGAHHERHERLSRIHEEHGRGEEDQGKRRRPESLLAEQREQNHAGIEVRIQMVHAGLRENTRHDQIGDDHHDGQHR